jgi:Kef-type K+ transport system membrane component KefB
LWRSKGTVEGIVTASFFGAARIAAFVGLSPIIEAFTVDMAMASTRGINNRRICQKLEIIFAPIFFAIIGSQIVPRGINMEILFLSAIVEAIAIITKLEGCGLSSILFLRQKTGL